MQIKVPSMILDFLLNDTFKWIYANADKICKQTDNVNLLKYLFEVYE